MRDKALQSRGIIQIATNTHIRPEKSRAGNACGNQRTAGYGHAECLGSDGSTKFVGSEP